MQRIIQVVLAAAFVTAPLAAQTTESADDNFKWTGKMPAGAWLTIANLNGSISVEQASGDVAEVVGEKDWRRGDPKDVRFAVVKDGDNMTICALWGEESSCSARGAHYRSHNHGWDDDHNDVSVKFTIKLPKGIKFDANTVNGSLDIAGATSEVEASTVNGKVEVVTGGGPVNAGTVNGSIRVSMAQAPGNEDLKFHTVNGSIYVTVPPSLEADLDMSTVNGSLTSDFPLMLQGRMNQKHIEAKIGNGGRRVSMSTVNGSIELRKGS